MKDVAVRIRGQDYERLKALATGAGEPMTETLSRAIEALQRARFLDGVNADFAALRADERAWAEEARERAEF